MMLDLMMVCPRSTVGRHKLKRMFDRTAYISEGLAEPAHGCAKRNGFRQ